MSRLNWCSISCISLFTLFRAVSCSSVLGVMIPISTVRHRQISLSVVASISSTIRGRKVFLWVNNVLLFSKILLFFKKSSLSLSWHHLFPIVMCFQESIFVAWVYSKMTSFSKLLATPDIWNLLLYLYIYTIKVMLREMIKITQLLKGLIRN